ncbi:hypothetical protein [Phocaeicola plebeius]|uniref:hypothetical protein n=1 Tax=Phocaeicola plebeius TaxID=310297 RepID=UPI00266C680E|nr:hypothetical protein [Phocaeicola plebeius]
MQKDYHFKLSSENESGTGKYISLIKQTSKETIRIKKTGWEEIKLPGHAHEKCQIIYTLSGTLHVQIGSTSYSPFITPTPSLQRT